MPSCVVKSCRNHSGFMKKNQGITFHRFPKVNDAWRNDWIQIIRNCRNENDWNPSKSSVICSVHFQADDLYITKGGFLRVVLYAVPKKFLSEPPSIQEDQPSVPDISIALQESALVTGGVVSDLEQQMMSEHSVSQSTTSSLFQSSSLYGLLVSSPEQQLTLEQSTFDTSPTSLLQNSFKTEVVPVEFDLERPLSVLHSLKGRRLKENLMRMHILMQKQKKKIKTLNQKVRRLRNRNKSLKNILKSLKEEKS